MKRLVSLTMAVCILLSAALTMPASALTAADFTDIPNNWAKPAIEYCLEKGLMSGVGKGKFDPKGTVTRAQIAQVLYNREGSPNVDGLENPFTDVSGQWFAKAVIWCKSMGIVSGNSATTFNPEGNVSRQDICVMVYNYYTKYLKKTAEMTEESKMSSTFTDWGKAAGYAKNALCWANKVGFMSGTSATTLDPKGQATREQLAQFLKNLDKVLENEKPGPSPSPEPEKCEHGNDPETCPICHPAPTPTPQGIYNPNPTDADMALGNSKFTDDEKGDLAGKLQWVLGEGRDFCTIMSDEDSAALFATGVSPVTGYALPELATVANANRDWTYTNFVPYKGYVVGGSTYDVTIGGEIYTKATEGSRIYNRYGVDVTDVDGHMTDTEYRFAQLFQSMEEEWGNTALWDPALQMAAEACLAESRENFMNLARAGVDANVKPNGGKATAAISHVTGTRNFAEASKNGWLTPDQLYTEAVYVNSTWSCDENGNYVGDWSYLHDSQDLNSSNPEDVRDDKDLATGTIMSYMAPNFCRDAYNENHSSTMSPLGDAGVTGEAAYFGSDVTNYSVVSAVCQERLANLNLGRNVSFGVAFDEATCQFYMVVVETTARGGYVSSRVDDSYAVKGFYLEGHD